MTAAVLAGLMLAPNAARSHPAATGPDGASYPAVDVAAIRHQVVEPTTTTTVAPVTVPTTVAHPAPPPAPPTTVAHPAPVAATAAPSHPAPAPPSRPAPSSTPGGYGCAAAIAYLSGHAAPGFRFECPGNALGHQAMTCIDVAGVCPGYKLIAIADPCAAAYMNEASNSWVLQGLRGGPIDPYGYCH
ncbi:MAG: hypothetical protein ACRDYY_14295 [Acidimicrobiales bacterium]